MAPALGPEGTSLSGPRHLLLFLLLLLLLRRRRRGPGGSHCQDLALLPDTLTPGPSQEGARACAAPDLGAINHARPCCAPSQHLARGSRLGQRAEPEGRGEQEARGPGAPTGGCGHRRFSLLQVAPAAGNSEPGLGAGEALGPRCAAPEQFATCRWPRDHLSSALGAAAGFALAFFSSPRRPRPARTTRARPTRTPRLQTVVLSRRLVLRLPARRAPCPAAGGPSSSHLPSRGGGPPPGPGGRRTGLGDSRHRRLGNRGAPGGRDRN